MQKESASYPPIAFLRLLIATFLISLFVAMPTAQAQLLPGTTGSDAQKSSADDDSVSLEHLADILEDDKSRDQLIKELRQAANDEQKEASKSATESTDDDARKVHGETTSEDEEPTFARRFADASSEWIEQASVRLQHTWDEISEPLTADENSSKTVEWGGFIDALITFLSVVVATIVPLFILRLLAGWLFSGIARLPDKARDKPARQALWMQIAAVATGLVVDAAVVLIAGGVGYGLALYVIGDGGSVATRESLFINAFVMIELIKVVVRVLFSAKYDNLRPLNLDPEVASWWSIRIRWFVGLVGYVLLVAVPVVSHELTPLAGSVLTFVAMGAAYLYALIVIFGNRRLLTERLDQRADRASLGFFNLVYKLFARIWLPLAVLYFTAMFVASLAYPERVLPDMLKASIATAGTAAVCFWLSGLLTKIIGRRIRLSPNVNNTMPTLEDRLNSYVPNALKVIRVVLLVLFVLITLNIWHVFNFNAWLSTPAGLGIVGTLFHVGLILAGAGAVWVIVASLLEHGMTPNSKREPSARQQTLLTLFRNAFAIVLVGFTVMITLSQIGVDIGPLVAGAGVFGLAIGFGAQNLVQDIITGIFIQLENAINAGDYVSLAGTEGTAERLTIRSVSLRDIDGVYHIVPFSQAGVVSNHQRFWAYFRTEYRVAFREDIDTAIYHLREAFHELQKDPAHKDNILEDILIPGVTEIDENAIKIRVMIKTTAGMQWAVGRAMNRLVKMHFDRANIEIPYPNQRLWFGENHDGEAPSAKVRMVSAEEDEERLPDYEKKRRRRGDDVVPEETGDSP